MAARIYQLDRRGLGCSFAHDEEPCWGEIEWVGETWDHGDVYVWVHACEGHRHVWNDGRCDGHYKKNGDDG